ncbi:unnamed protein product [Adineta steineri]|uniref:EF-hand domain-containing protein n=1 Tax=Adineta steineri TaxID=433720 RepID=A0A819P714_9BILA|nr:unnamed protein product [Adineta steineri]
MDESLTKSQKYLFMEREFIKTKEKEKIMKTKMSYDILKKFFGDKSNNRLYQLVNEADKDGTDNVELEDFMKIVDDLLNQEKDDDDDDFLDDESYDDRFKDFAQKMGDLANQNAPISPTTVKELLKEFKIELVKE